MVDADYLARRMRQDWDARADLDPWHYVLFREPCEWRREGARDIDDVLARINHTVPAQGRVLEIGCGVGRLTWTFAVRAREVWALDVSPRMIALAREQLKECGNVRFLLGNGTDLSEVPDGSVDLVFSALTFTHLPHRELVSVYLREAARTLAAGGRLAIQVNNEGRLRFLARMATHRGLRLLRLRSGRRGMEHGRTWTGSRVPLELVRATLERAGLRWLKASGAGTLACWVYAARDDRSA